jgi:hypothetical protein
VSIIAKVTGHVVALPEGFDLPDGSLVRIEPCGDTDASSADFIRRTNAAYTPQVCEQTLRVNETLPVDEG